MLNKIPCTVGVLTFNNAKTLHDTLASLSACSEIIVCDGGSTDGTLELARAYGARVIEQDPRFKRPDNKIADFGGVRNQMLDVASNDWFLYVDSDEIMTPALLIEIERVVAHGEPIAYWIPRKYVVDGLVIDCASTYPSKQMRLFHKAAVKRFIKTIHERIELREGARVEMLTEHMLIPIMNDYRDMRRKWSYYVALERARRPRISLIEWLRTVFENAKVSLLYLFRLVRNRLFCRGTQMPLSLELERHVYHVRMCVALAHNIVSLT